MCRELYTFPSAFQKGRRALLFVHVIHLATRECFRRNFEDISFWKLKILMVWQNHRILLRWTLRYQVSKRPVAIRHQCPTTFANDPTRRVQEQPKWFAVGSMFSPRFRWRARASGTVWYFQAGWEILIQSSTGSLEWRNASLHWQNGDHVCIYCRQAWGMWLHDSLWITGIYYPTWSAYGDLSGIPWKRCYGKLR